MKILMKRLMGSLILVSFLTQFAHAANSCQSIFLDSSTIQTDELFLTRPGRPGGVINAWMHDQHQGENCWSHALTSLAEAEYRKAQIEKKLLKNPLLNKEKLLDDRAHHDMRLSAEHGLFWHIYFQIKGHLGSFRKQMHVLNEDKPDLTDGWLRKMVKKVYGLWKPKKVDPSKAFQPDLGNTQETALDEARIVGLVPLAQFDIPATTEEKQAWLDEAIPRFIGEFVLNEENLDRYLGKDDDGINTALFEDLARFLKPAFPTKPIRPNETFTYRNRVSTPLKFMRENVGFQPEDWVEVVSDNDTLDLAMQAIADSVNHDFAVPIGLDILGNDDDLQTQQRLGLFSDKTCEGDCDGPSWGHEMLAVNFVYRQKSSQPTGIIAQNSWGPTGHRDIDGTPTKLRSEQGFFAITKKYLKKVGQIDFLLNKKIANNPKYKGKFSE